jgi:SAM-dependent methyltransferase
MAANPFPPSRSGDPAAALPRSLWKKAWRFFFRPFYRHFDILHLEVEELKSSLQSSRLLHDQLRLETRPRLQQIGVELGQLRDAAIQVERRLSGLDETVDSLRDQMLPRLEGSLRSLERLRREMDRIENPAGEWFNYTSFEDKFRGHEDEIIKRQSVYLSLLKKHAVVADLGCGRGELLEVLRRANVEALGVELHPQQAQRCRDKGLRVEPADFMTWLSVQTGGAYGAITALQVVEHLHLSEVDRLIREAFRALRSGGLILLETVNPHSADAMEWFYIDPTHKRPVYPEILELQLASAGFVKRELRFQSLSASAPKDTELNSRTGSDFAIWGIKP